MRRVTYSRPILDATIIARGAVFAFAIALKGDNTRYFIAYCAKRYTLCSQFNRSIEFATRKRNGDAVINIAMRGNRFFRILSTLPLCLTSDPCEVTRNAKICMGRAGTRGRLHRVKRLLL